MTQRELTQVRKIALSLPGVNERFNSVGTRCFFVRDKRPLCYYHDNHRGDGRVSLWFPATTGIQDILVAPEGGLFFRPQPSASGTFGDWVGVFLDMQGDDRVDWGELSVLVEDAYRRVAPKKLITELNTK
jgi:hypothetical protein